MRRSLFAAAAIVMIGAVLAAQQPSEHQTFRSERDILTVEASVRDEDGRVLADLRPSDFTVRVDGQPRTVLTAHFYGEGRSAAPPNPVGRYLRSIDAVPGVVLVTAVDRESIKRGNERAAVDAAARMIESLSPADAAAAVAVPGTVVDVTRDRQRVADAVRAMTGTRPLHGWTHHLSWTEALAFERGQRLTVDEINKRECPPDGPPQLDPCQGQVRQQATEMVMEGRAHGSALLETLTAVIAQLDLLQAPKRLVLLSGGVPFDEELASRYRDLADRAARAHVALSVVQLDQPVVDIADALSVEQAVAGPEYETGLANIASTTGGTFAHVVAAGGGVFDRIKVDVSEFYQLGVESRPSDADGQTHRIEVRVTRAHATVVSPAATAASPVRAADAAIQRALRQPLAVPDLSFEAAFYTTHSRERDNVRVILAAYTADGAAPSAWGFAVLDGGTVVQGRTIQVDDRTAGAWAATATIDVPPGTYEVRIAAVGADGRMGVIDAMAPIGLRAAGDTRISDLMIGTIEQGTLQPRRSIRQDDRSAAMIELSSPHRLQGVRAMVQIAPAGSTDAIARAALTLRTRKDDASVVVGEGTIDLSSVPPGTYAASAVLEQDGKPFARVSRWIEIDAAAARPAPIAAHDAPKVSLAAAVRAEPETAAMMQRVAGYVDDYGNQASVLVAVERYRQEGTRDFQSGLPSGRTRGGIVSAKTARTLTSEIALVRNATAVGGWLGFRSVTEVDGKPAGDPQRLRAVFAETVPDVEAARRLTQESTRYNVGPVSRSFNVPTAALFFFASSNVARFTFHHNGHEAIDDVDAWKIDFEETAKPTLIMTSAGKDVRSTGTLWVDAASGRVLRTRLVLSNYSGASSSAMVDVTYREDASVEMLVPAVMREWYSLTGGRLAAEATYADYKRFQTSVRIK
jgi:VWFA-related protein